MSVGKANPAFRGSGKIRKPYEIVEPVRCETVGPTMTRQEFKEDCDINRILGQYRKTGMIAHRNTHQGQYGEFAKMDFHEAMNFVVETQEMFETVPSDVRSKFGNDPGAFVDFVTNSDNLDEMREMGLAPPQRPEPAPPAPPAPEEPPAQ